MIINIKTSLSAIRQASLTVNANLARSIILRLIQAASPDLLGDRARYRPKGQAPIFFIATTRRFFSEQLGWSSRKETKDGQKTPNDWEILCEKTFFRFFYTIRKEKIIYVGFVLTLKVIISNKDTAFGVSCMRALDFDLISSVEIPVAYWQITWAIVMVLTTIEYPAKIH